MKVVGVNGRIFTGDVFRDALKATKDGYRNSLDMGWDAAMDYSSAKEMELVLRQGDFVSYQPGSRHNSWTDTGCVIAVFEWRPDNPVTGRRENDHAAAPATGR